MNLDRIRALLNDREGRVFTDERLATFTHYGESFGEIYAAGLAANSVGATDISDRMFNLLGIVVTVEEHASKRSPETVPPAQTP